MFATSPQVEFPPSQPSRERVRTRCLFADVGSEHNHDQDDDGDGNDDDDDYSKASPENPQALA